MSSSKVGSKRRRSKAEIAEAKEREANREQLELERQNQIDQLQASVAQKDNEILQGNNARELVQQLLNNGVLERDENGLIQVP